MFNSRPLKLLSISVASVVLSGALSGCGLFSAPGGYTDAEKQTLQDLDRSKFTPRTDQEREAVLTQDLFTQTAFWSREYELNPADLEAAVNLSAALRKMGNPSKAIEVSQQTRALYPRDINLIAELAAAEIANNDPTSALKVIDSGLRLAPNTARLWSLKGASLDNLERFDEARQQYSRALSLKPNDSGTLANVGLSYALQGDPKTAEVWLRQAAAQPDASPAVRQNLALVLGLQDKYAEAEALIRQDMEPDVVANNLAYLHSLRGSSKTAPAPTPSPQTSNISSYAQPKPRRLSPNQKPANSMQPRTYGQTQQTVNPSQSMAGAYQPQAQDQVQAQAQARAQAQYPGQAYPRIKAAPNPQMQARIPGQTHPSYQPMRQGAQMSPNSSSVLSTLKAKNTSKVDIARQQQAVLQQRRQQQMQQQQAQYRNNSMRGQISPMGPQMMPQYSGNLTQNPQAQNNANRANLPTRLPNMTSPSPQYQHYIAQQQAQAQQAGQTGQYQAPQNQPRLPARARR